MVSILKNIDMHFMLKRLSAVALVCFQLSAVQAQTFPNSLAANSVDPVSDSIAISRMRVRLDSIRQTEHRPTVALVLSGGGAKGAAYIGLFRYLEEEGIPVDLLCGTSMGGLMSGLYSLGYDSYELEDIINSIDWSLMMSDNIDPGFLSFEQKEDREKFLMSIPFHYEDDAHAKREMVFDNDFDDSYLQSSESRKKLLSSIPTGYISGFNVENMLANLSVGFHEDINFEDLPVPFFCVSSDLVSAKANYHTGGSLLKAIRSTISIPGVFAPVRTNGRILVDGGTRNNFPVDIAKAMGADIIIGVEVAKRGTTYSQVNSVVDIVNCMITMLGDDARSNKSFTPDMLIKPETGDMSMLSFNSEAIAEMIDYGYEAAQEKADEFRKIKEQLGNYRRTDTSVRKKAINLYNQNVNVSGIMVNGIDKDEQNIFRRILDLKGHREISQKEIDDALCRVMASGSFEKVNYTLQKDEGEDTYTLVLDCVPGQVHNMGFGFRLDTEEMAELLFNVRLNAHKLKGWRFDATAKMSIQQSLDLTASYIPDGFAQINFRTSAAYIRSDINTENLNTVYNIAFFDTRQELYMSTIHGRSFNLRGGLRHEYASIPVSMPLYSISGPGSNYLKVADTARKGHFLTAFADLDVNTLNDRQFPTRGFRGSVGFDYDMANFAAENYEPVPIVNADAMLAIPATRWLTVTPSLYYRSYFSKVDIYSQSYSHIHNNYVGGAIRGRYMPQQIPFTGFGDVSEMFNHVYSLELDARFKLGRKLYLSGIGGVVREKPTLQELFEDISPSFWGCAMELGYRTFFGPVKFNLHWSDSPYVVGLNGYFSVGFDF